METMPSLTTSADEHKTCPISPSSSESIIKKEIQVKQDTQDVCIRLRSFNQKNAVRISRYDHSRPHSETQYFTKPSRPGGLAVVCPFFNEPRTELQTTLESLHQSFLYLNSHSDRWANQPIHVVIILDGWYKADPSMIDYLKDLFPGDASTTPWWDQFSEFSQQPSQDDLPITFVLETKDDAPVAINPGAETEKLCHVTALIKIDNRRKHNSHEWFFGQNGFAEGTQAEYLLCIDAFTILSQTCLYHLVKLMDRNPDISAATGRQRVMSRIQQGTSESMFSFAYLLRMVQLFDFEIANAVYNGAFSLAGFLPVIPGPCGLYRAREILQDAARDWYFEVVNEEPDETGMVLGNLRIAEDRVLTYASVLKTEQVRRIALAPLAVFYFEAELSLKRLILQRRRWINGAVAGYIWLLFKAPGHIWRHWNASFLRKLYIWLLLSSLMLAYAGLALGPGFMVKLLHVSVVYLTRNIYGLENWDTIAMGTVGVAFALYILHVIVHSFRKFESWLFNALTILTLVISITSFWAIAHFALYSSGSRDMYLTLLTTARLHDPLAITVGLSLIVSGMSFVLGLTISGRGHSFWHMLRSFFQYAVMSPMTIAWFGAYSFARTWDLSWGNRPVDQLQDVRNEEVRNRIQRTFRQQSARLSVGLVAANLLLYHLDMTYLLSILALFLTTVTFLMLGSLLYHFKTVFDKLRFASKVSSNAVRTLTPCAGKQGIELSTTEAEQRSNWQVQNQHTVTITPGGRSKLIAELSSVSVQGPPPLMIDAATTPVMGHMPASVQMVAGAPLASATHAKEELAGIATLTTKVKDRATSHLSLEGQAVAYLQELQIRSQELPDAEPKLQRLTQQVLRMWIRHRSNSEFVHKFLILYEALQAALSSGLDEEIAHDQFTTSVECLLRHKWHSSSPITRDEGSRFLLRRGEPSIEASSPTRSRASSIRSHPIQTRNGTERRSTTTAPTSTPVQCVIETSLDSRRVSPSMSSSTSSFSRGSSEEFSSSICSPSSTNVAAKNAAAYIEDWIARTAWRVSPQNERSPTRTPQSESQVCLFREIPCSPSVSRLTSFTWSPAQIRSVNVAKAK